ncbi:putative ubiquitin carboxyl-terminal hydrolase 46, partial [Stegodyphus mimosarum]
MARFDVKASAPVVNLSNGDLASSVSKTSRLSLKKLKDFSPKVYKEENNYGHHDMECDVTESKDVDQIEICGIQDENASPNCSVAMTDLKPAFIPSVVESSDISEIKVTPLGLPNCGNTCYVNSILQVLRYTPNFLNCLHSLLMARHYYKQRSLLENEAKETAVFLRLHSLFSAMRKQELLSLRNKNKDYSGYLIKPYSSFVLTLREISSLFEEGKQHDAHELLLTIISAFSTACEAIKEKSANQDIASKSQSTFAIDLKITELSVNETVHTSGQKNLKRKQIAMQNVQIKKRRKSETLTMHGNPIKNSSDIINIENINLGFEGKIHHSIMCLECENKLEHEEIFTNLEVTVAEQCVKEDAVDLRECLSQTTILSGENKYYCEECLHYNEARLGSKVILPPSILLLHFSWFTRSSNMTDVEKADMKVIIPLLLETSENCDLFSCTPHQIYRLYAVVLHIGQSTDGGHYVAFVKDVSQRSPSKQDSEQKF